LSKDTFNSSDLISFAFFPFIAFYIIEIIIERINLGGASDQIILFFAYFNEFAPSLGLYAQELFTKNSVPKKSIFLVWAVAKIVLRNSKKNSFIGFEIGLFFKYRKFFYRW
jgi:hypothetical protein